MSRPILVTGAAGFIGSRFVESCNQKGIPVVSVDQLKFFHSRAEMKGIHFGETVEINQTIRWLKEHTPSMGRESTQSPLSAIVHMGACSDTTEMNVEFLTQNNVEYSKRLWEYCTEMKIPFVYASSAATYGAGELGYEDDENLISKLRPLNPYGNSKKIFDEWVLEQEKLGKTPPLWSGFKFFNVYGYGEAHKGKMASVIWHAYSQIKETGRVKLFQSHKSGIADGEQKRDFISVLDVVRVLHFALDHPLKRGLFNLGTGKARTFLDLAKATFQAMGKKAEIEFIPTPESLRTRYQYFTQANMSKLREAGYTHPFLELEEGAEKYIQRLKKSGLFEI